MAKRTTTIAVLMGLSLLALGGLWASNMGFKLNYQLLSASNPGSADGSNTVGLPFKRHGGLVTASDLINDIGSGNVQNVQRYVESTGAIETRTAGGSGPNFSLAVGEAYFVKMSADADYVIVGAHEPTFSVDLDSAGEPDSSDGTNFYARPYHSTATTAQELINDIGSGSVQNVQRFVPASGVIETRTAGGSGPNFDLKLGEGYFIKMNATVPYVPSHF